MQESLTYDITLHHGVLKWWCDKWIMTYEWIMRYEKLRVKKCQHTFFILALNYIVINIFITVGIFKICYWNLKSLKNTSCHTWVLYWQDKCFLKKKIVKLNYIILLLTHSPLMLYTDWLTGSNSKVIAA